MRRGAFCSRGQIKRTKEVHNTYLQVLTHLFRKSAEANTCEIVDREPGVFWILQWEHAARKHFHFRIRKAFFHGRKSHSLCNFLEHDFDENSAGASCILFIDLHRLQNSPGYCVVRDKVSKETRNVTKTVRLVAMDRVVVIVECFLKALIPHSIKFAEALTDQAIEYRIRALLRAALDQHIDELDLGMLVSANIGISSEWLTSSPSLICTFNNLWTASS